MSTETSEFPILWQDTLAGLLAVFLFLVPIEQILTLKILHREENRRKRLTPYLINLAVANLVFVFSSFTFAFASNLSRRYVASKKTCIIFGYLSSASVLTVFATFAACTGTVYNAITEPKTTQLILRGRKDTKIVYGIWLFSFVILSPMIAIWNRDAFHPNTSGCTPMWTLKTSEDIAYFVILTILGFSSPMILNLVYSVKIYLFFANMGQVTFHQRRRFQEYKNVSKMIIVSVAVFVICWTPFTIFNPVSLFGYRPSPGVGVIPYLFSKSSVLYNPIIYAVFNARFRDAIVDLFCCGCRKSQVSPMTPNCAGLQEPHPHSFQPMVPRAPVLCSVTNSAFDTLYEEPRRPSNGLRESSCKETLEDIKFGLPLYSLE